MYCRVCVCVCASCEEVRNHRMTIIYFVFWFRSAWRTLQERRRRRSKKKSKFISIIEFYKHLNWNEPGSDWLTESAHTNDGQTNKSNRLEWGGLRLTKGCNFIVYRLRRRRHRVVVVVVIVARFESPNEYVNFVRVNQRHRRPAAAVATNNNNEVNK